MKKKIIAKCEVARMATRAAVGAACAMSMLALLSMSARPERAVVLVGHTLPHGAGGDIMSEFGQYGKALGTMSSAVASVGGGVSSGIFAPAAASMHPAAAAASAGAAAVSPTTPVAGRPQEAVASAVKSPRRVRRQSAATRSRGSDPDTAPMAEPLGHRMGAKAAVQNMDAFFGGTGPSPAAADPVAAPRAKPAMDGRLAVKDIEGYFDAMPTTDVNAFHEPTKVARHFGKTYGSKRSRTELNAYFNQLAKDVHTKEFASKAAVKDLTSYYSKLPTKDVAADHSRTLKKPAKADFASTTAVKELGRYFDEIPVQKVNPFHERAHGAHTPSLPEFSGTPATCQVNRTPGVNSSMHRPHSACCFEAPTCELVMQPELTRLVLSAADAAKDLADYYGDLPVKTVNAFHEKAAQLAAEKEAAARLRPRASSPRPTLTASPQEEAAPVVDARAVRDSTAARTEQRLSPVAVAEDNRNPEGRVGDHARAGDGQQGDDFLRWQDVDNRKGYKKLARASKAAALKLAAPSFRTVQDDSSSRHTRYEKVAGSDGSAAKLLARDEVEGERHLRDKTRNWAALSDAQGRDADAPRLSSAERHAGGYDTQYGQMNRLGSKVIETTPEGQVVTHLVTRKFAKAFPESVGPEGREGLREGRRHSSPASGSSQRRAAVASEPSQADGGAEDAGGSLRGFGGQVLAQQRGRVRGARQQQLAPAGHLQHEGLAYTVGRAVIGGTCSVFGIAC